MAHGESVEDIVDEFSGAALGDRRLHTRLETIVQAVGARPSLSFPNMMSIKSELEGFYRFIRNEKVTFESLLESHYQATVRRIEEHVEVRVIHDTTNFSVTSHREGVGALNKSGHGFL